MTVIFQDGGQTVNFKAKRYKDPFQRPYDYLSNELKKMRIRPIEAKIS